MNFRIRNSKLKGVCPQNFAEKVVKSCIFQKVRYSLSAVRKDPSSVEQPLWSSFARVFLLQARHIALPSVGAYDVSWQFSHDEAPTALANVPFGHFTQDVAPDKSSEYVPAAHSTHVTRPAAAADFPTSQASHPFSRTSWLLDFPGSQFLQADSSAAAELVE